MMAGGIGLWAYRAMMSSLLPDSIVNLPNPSALGTVERADMKGRTLHIFAVSLMLLLTLALTVQAPAMAEGALCLGHQHHDAEVAGPHSAVGHHHTKGAQEPNCRCAGFCLAVILPAPLICAPPPPLAAPVSVAAPALMGISGSGLDRPPRFPVSI